MADFLTAVGLLLVLEGALYALLPNATKRMASEVLRLPESFLRTTGLVVACVGFAMVWLIRG